MNNYNYKINKSNKDMTKKHNKKNKTKKNISLVANVTSKNQMKKKEKKNIKKKLQEICKQNKLKLELELNTIITRLSTL